MYARYTSRRGTLPEANHRERRDAPRSRKRIGRREIRVATAQPLSSTVGDRSPRDAFPASSSWFAEGSVSRRLTLSCAGAKCEAEPLPRRRAGSLEQACLVDSIEHTTGPLSTKRGRSRCFSGLSTVTDRRSRRARLHLS